MSKQMEQLRDIVKTTTGETKALVTTINKAVQLFDAVSDLGVDSIIEKVKSGQFRKMEELAGAMKAAQQLPTIMKNLQDKLPQLQKVVQDMSSKGPEFVESLQGIFSRNWLQDYEGDLKSADKISDQVFQVQKLAAQLNPQAVQLYSSIAFLTDSLGSVANTGKVGQVDVKVASYQRWTRGSFVMPCLTTGKFTFKIAGFKSTVGYPKVRVPRTL